MRQERTRTALVKAAHALMSERGVDAVSLQEITDRANVGAGTFYNYFASKDDIARQVLDCYIENLTHRQEASVGSLGLADPVAVIAVSARSCVRELLSNPLWFWWLRRPDLLVERMRTGFRASGLRDLAAAVGAIAPPAGGHEAVWSMMIWHLVTGARDTVDGLRSHDAEAAITVGVLQALGVASDTAVRLAATEPPPYPERPTDFAFVLPAG